MHVFCFRFCVFWQFPDEHKASDERGVSVGIRKDNYFYRMDAEFSEAAVAEFVEAYVKGTVQVRPSPFPISVAFNPTILALLRVRCFIIRCIRCSPPAAPR